MKKINIEKNMKMLNPERAVFKILQHITSYPGWLLVWELKDMLNK